MWLVHVSNLTCFQMMIREVVAGELAIDHLHGMPMVGILIKDVIHLCYWYRVEEKLFSMVLHSLSSSMPAIIWKNSTTNIFTSKSLPSFTLIYLSSFLFYFLENHILVYVCANCIFHKCWYLTLNCHWMTLWRTLCYLGPMKRPCTWSKFIVLRDLYYVIKECFRIFLNGPYQILAELVYGHPILRVVLSV